MSAHQERTLAALESIAEHLDHMCKLLSDIVDVLNEGTPEPAPKPKAKKKAKAKKSK